MKREKGLVFSMVMILYLNMLFIYLFTILFYWKRQVVDKRDKKGSPFFSMS